MPTIVETTRRPYVSRDDYARALIDATSEVMLAIDADFIILCANPSASRLFGIDMDDLVGSSLVAHVPGLKDAAVEDFGMPSADSVLARITAAATQVETRTRRGKVKVELTATPSRVDGDPVWAIVLRDMTELNSSHHTLLQAHRELEEFNRLAVGREIRMVELKQEINSLLAELGREPRYEVEV